MNGEDRGGINVTGRKTESNGRELNYLEWLSAHTPTKWWHDSAIPDEIERGLSMGALGITTNPVLTYKTFNACPDYWRDRVAAVPDELDFAARAEEMLRIVATDAASRVHGVFERTGGAHGYAFGQLNPTLAADFAGYARDGPTVRTWGSERRCQAPYHKGRRGGDRGTGGARRTPMRYVELFRCAGCRCFRGVRTRREPRRRGPA